MRPDVAPAAGGQASSRARIARPASTASSAGSTAPMPQCSSTTGSSQGLTTSSARAASSAPRCALRTRSRWCRRTRMSTKTLITRELLTGGEAVAHAMRQIDPDVVPVYPITPQTPIIQAYAQFVADGRASGELVDVESEHSAMSAAIGSALAGARTMTATSSQGLALMAEVVYIAASMRAPIVTALGNRALSGPINIHCDHSDSMLIRDSGVVQLFVENAQEAYDATILAPRLAEHPDVLLPVFVCLDGFTITHSAEPVELLDDAEVQAFVGDYRIPFPLLDASRPATQGPFAMPDYYFELRRGQARALEA